MPDFSAANFHVPSVILLKILDYHVMYLKKICVLVDTTKVISLRYGFFTVVINNM